MKPLRKVTIQWSGKFAYAIGLLASDGNLSKDGRHIDFTSKDLDLIETFKKCLGVDNKIGRKSRAKEKEKKYFKIVIGDVCFYRYLVSIGLHPAKSKTIQELKIHKRYFGDFLRGCIDGDGNIDVFHHKESKHYQLKLRLASASLDFLEWIREKNTEVFRIKGGWIDTARGAYSLCFGKQDALIILKRIYGQNKPCLLRKYAIVQQLLRD